MCMHADQHYPNPNPADHVRLWRIWLCSNFHQSCKSSCNQSKLLLLSSLQSLFQWWLRRRLRSMLIYVKPDNDCNGDTCGRCSSCSYQEVLQEVSSYLDGRQYIWIMQCLGPATPVDLGHFHYVTVKQYLYWSMMPHHIKYELACGMVWASNCCRQNQI